MHAAFTTNKKKEVIHRLYPEGRFANSSAAEVQRLYGTKSGGSSYAKTELVETKLAVVRAGWLLQYFGIVRRFCWRDLADRLRRDEIH